MNIWLRRTYFLLSVLSFAIIATGLVFYAAGWRFDLNTRSVGQVGALSVNSQPSNANVYFDGELLKDKTPLSANDLVADQYHLSIWKNGYYDWQQDIEITKSVTTYIDDVYLIKKQTLNKYFINSEIIYYQISNNKNFIALQTPKKELVVYDLDKAEMLSQTNINQEITEISWNQNDTSFIIKANDIFYLYNLSEKKLIDLNDLYGLNATNYFWVADQANNIIAVEKNNFYQINKFQQTIQASDLPAIPIYSTNNIYFCGNEEPGKLFAYNTEKQILSETNIAGIDQVSELTFNKMLNGFLPIIDQVNNKGYFYDFDNKRFSSIDQTLKSIDFINSNNILYVNNHEIWQIDNNNDQKNLLLRTAETINSAYWLIDNQYVIYITDNNQIKISEINRSQNNNYSIDHDMINDLIRGPDNNTFYLINNLGIYKLEF